MRDAGADGAVLDLGTMGGPDPAAVTRSTPRIRRRRSMPPDRSSDLKRPAVIYAVRYLQGQVRGCMTLASLPRASASFPTERPNQPELRRGKSSSTRRSHRGGHRPRLEQQPAVPDDRRLCRRTHARRAQVIRWPERLARLGDPGEPVAVGRATTARTQASSSAACQTGAIEADCSYPYLCPAPNVWKLRLVELLRHR
jgi:hypothetical protein